MGLVQYNDRSFQFDPQRVSDGRLEHVIVRCEDKFSIFRQDLAQIIGTSRVGRVVVVIRLVYVTSNDIQSDGVLRCISESAGNLCQREVTDIFSVKFDKSITLSKSTLDLGCPFFHLTDSTAPRT